MYAPSNYNQVGELRQQSGRLINLLVMLMIATGLLITFLNWPPFTLLLLIAVMTLLAVTLGWLTWRQRQQRKVRCRFCGGPLDQVQRPLMLNAFYLARPGQKVDDSYYLFDTEGLSPYRDRWIRITHQSWACHHCKLLEKTWWRHYAPASEREVLAHRLSRPAERTSKKRP